MARSTHKKEALTVSSKTGCGGTMALVVFFAIFLFVGLFFMYLIADSVVMPYIRSGNFVQIPCTITRSEVSDRMDDGSRLYAAEIEYDYEYLGQKYHSDKTGFSDSSGSWKGSYQAVVDRYPLGSQQVCFVDPEKHDYAVLERKWSWMFLMLGIPGLFVLVGTGGIIGVLMPSRPKRNQYFGSSSAINSQDKLAYGEDAQSSVVATSLDMILKNQPFPHYDAGLAEKPRELPTMTSPVMILGCAIFFALFWNGITWLIFISMLRDNNAKFFGLAFMSLFLLVGLGLIAWVFYQFLALFNPKPTVAISRSLLPIGSSSDLTWKFSSTPTSMSQLVIKLIGEEEAQYRRGTDTVTDKKIFFEKILFDSFEPTAMEQGTVQVEIPDNSMHTFMASHNKIRWKITLKGSIPKWPDVMHDYELLVCPHAPE